MKVGSLLLVAAVAGGCGATQEGASSPQNGTTVYVPPIAAGASTACAVTAEGSVACWDLSDAGGSAEVVAGVSPATAIAVGSAHACAVVGSGAVRCWGNDAYGQSGAAVDPSCESSPHGSCTVPPADVAGIDAAVGIAAGNLHTCALDGDGSVHCWGSDEMSQLGAEASDRCGVPQGGGGKVPCSSTPLAVAGIAGAVQLAADSSADHSCAMTGDGNVYCWGADSFGELGDGSRRPSGGVVRVREVHGARAVAVRRGRSAALLDDGSVVCWGQCGPGLTLYARPVENMRGAVDLGTGANFDNCLRLGGGSVACACPSWTRGTGTPCDTTFHPVAGLEGAATVVNGWSAACARLVDSSVWCWGKSPPRQVALP